MMVLSKLRTWGHGEPLEDNNNTIKRDILRDSQTALSAHSRCTYFSFELFYSPLYFLVKKLIFLGVEGPSLLNTPP